VSLVPDAANRSFSATATISLDIRQATSSLTLNAADLAVQRQRPSAPALASQTLAATRIEHRQRNKQTATFDL
jgi:hypothetical protein